MVREVWEEDIDGIAMYRIVQKLRKLKQRLKRLHKSKYSNMVGRLKSAKDLLDDVQQKLQRDPKNNVVQQQEKRAYEEYTVLAKAELSLFQQKAKEVWLKEMDQNSAFFHARVVEKKSRARISRIFDGNGNMVEDEDEIAKLFIEFYNGLLGSSREDLQPVDVEVLQNGPKLSEQHKNCLMAAVTEQEIHTTIFSMDKEKASGPNGYGSGFYKRSWHIIQEEVNAAILEFFRTGRILKQVNNTLITLIPKTPCANSVEDYRPISCCNVLYKIISKSLANRLANVLPDIISSS